MTRECLPGGERRGPQRFNREKKAWPYNPEGGPEPRMHGKQALGADPGRTDCGYSEGPWLGGL